MGADYSNCICYVAYYVCQKFASLRRYGVDLHTLLVICV